MWAEAVSYSSLHPQLLAQCLAYDFLREQPENAVLLLGMAAGTDIGIWAQPTLSTHLVKVVLNVQDLLRQQSQAIEQHSRGLVNHRQVDQPGRKRQGLGSGPRPERVGWGPGVRRNT